MKKILVLTLAMVFALASVAFAEVKISGELKSTVKYNVVDDDEDYKGAALDTAKVTLAAEEEGVWSASVTLKSKNGLGKGAVTDVEWDEDADEKLKLTRSDGHSAVVLDAYQFQFVDEWFTLDAWGGEAEVAEYGTALGFIKAPEDAETVRFTTGLPEGEAVVDFSDDIVRLFGKYQVDPSLSFGAAAQRSGYERYSVWGTGAIEGVTVSGEFMRDARVEGNKYGAKAEYKVADLKLTGQFVRDEAVAAEADESTELKFGVAYANDNVPYSASVDYKVKSYEDDNEYNEIVLKGDYDVVPEFVTVKASYTKAEDSSGDRYTFTWHDFNNDEQEDDKGTEYSRIELGADITLTEKLTVKPGVELETIKNSKAKAPADEVDVTTYVVDVEYAVTDNASVTYGFKRIAQETDGRDNLGYFNTLGVKLTF